MAGGCPQAASCPPSALNGHSMIVEIAGLAFDVRVNGVDFSSRLLERYEGFLTESASAPFCLTFTVDPDRHPERLHPTYVDNPPLTARGSLAAVSVAGEGFEGVLDFELGRGSATIPDSLAHLDLFVRIALGGLLLREGSTLLHSAAVVRDHFGVVFSGPSGAGKSTIARVCREDGQTVLADEMVVVRRQGSGTRVFGTPFWHGRNISAPLGALFFLAHASQHKATRLKPADALPLLLKAGGSPLPLADFQAAFFNACGEVLRRVAPYRLEFAPEPRFWSAIDRLPEFAFFRPKPKKLASLSAKSGPKPQPLGSLKRS